jgi:23S rRNA (cytidine1920-2'-O)/16S rRNA (cytidine1409-2'-O)-methyltransferase
MTKMRLDLLLVERGLVESRAKAQALIMAGQVRVEDQVADKAGANVAGDAKITLDSGPRFVSRGGEKLEAALGMFPLNVKGRLCADVGASTGGFTDCLLQHGAARVYAIDVGKWILHWKLRTDPRVVVMEETNARFVDTLPEPVSLVVIDTSFISLKILLPVVKEWVPSDILCLIKPQFEAGRKESARHKGVIRDPEVHRLVLMDVLAFAQDTGYTVRGLGRSPVLGPKGNVEFLAWLGMQGEDIKDVKSLVQSVVSSAV